jgi:hypothetical protein
MKWGRHIKEAGSFMIGMFLVHPGYKWKDYNKDMNYCVA